MGIRSMSLRQHDRPAAPVARHRPPRADAPRWPGGQLPAAGAHASGWAGPIRARAALAAVLVAAGLVGACHADSVTGTGAIDGTYALRTVNAKTLPTTVYDSARAGGPRLTVTITGGTMALSPDGSYTFALRYTFAIDSVAQPVAPLTDSGTFSRNGASLLFASFARSGSMSGTLAGGDLTMALDILDTGTPLVMVYRR